MEIFPLSPSPVAVVRARTSLVLCKDGGVSCADSCCVLLRESAGCAALGHWPAFGSFFLPFTLWPRCLELQEPTWLRQAKFINIKMQNLKLVCGDGAWLEREPARERDEVGRSYFSSFSICI